MDRRDPSSPKVGSPPHQAGKTSRTVIPPVGEQILSLKSTWVKPDCCHAQGLQLDQGAGTQIKGRSPSTSHGPGCRVLGPHLLCHVSGDLITVAANMRPHPCQQVSGSHVSHGADGGRKDPRQESHSTGVSNPDDTSFRVSQHDGHAIGDPNGQCDPGEDGDHGISDGEFPLACDAVSKIALRSPPPDVVSPDSPHVLAVHLMTDHHRTKTEAGTQRLQVLENGGILVSASEIEPVKTVTPPGPGRQGRRDP